MQNKKEIIDSLNRRMPYCTNHKCINYYEDSCMYNVSEDGLLKTTPMNDSDGKCEAFISGKHLLYLEESLEITERYQALVEAVRETMNMNKVEDSAFGAYERGWQDAANRINQAIDCYIPQNTDESKELINRITAATEFLNELNKDEQPWISITEIEWERGNKYIDDMNGHIWYVSDDEVDLESYDGTSCGKIENSFFTSELAQVRFRKILESEGSNE